MKHSIIALLFLCAAGMLTACGKRDATDVAGLYKGEYFGGVEVFTLRADGSFTQSFSVNGKRVYESQGSWSIDGRTVRFKNFMKAYWFTDEDFSSFRKPLDKFSASMPVGANAIIFSKDGDYFVRKQ